MTIQQSAAALKAAADNLLALAENHSAFLMEHEPFYSFSGAVAFSSSQAGAVIKHFGGLGWHRETGGMIADWTKRVDGVTIKLCAMEDLAPRSGPVPPDQIAIIMERHAKLGEAAAADMAEHLADAMEFGEMEDEGHAPRETEKETSGGRI